MAKNKRDIPFEELKKADQIQYMQDYKDGLYEYYIDKYSVKETTSYEAIMVNRQISKVDRWITLMKKIN